MSIGLPRTVSFFTKTLTAAWGANLAKNIYLERQRLNNSDTESNSNKKADPTDAPREVDRTEQKSLSPKFPPRRLEELTRQTTTTADKFNISVHGAGFSADIPSSAFDVQPHPQGKMITKPFTSFDKLIEKGGPKSTLFDQHSRINLGL